MKLSELQFDDSGLIPVTVQSELDGRVLMSAFMSDESVRLSLETGQMHFFSRSRKQIWHKGLTSGNFQQLVSLHADCDKDALLAVVRESGPACHTGERSCFDNFEALELS
jgi:phosphoribosyl-ATP pyrophosphohydrolase/phosphoribosyl-AMP cyclohydrolase